MSEITTAASDSAAVIETVAEAPVTKITAQGRSGQVVIRNGHFADGKGFAVCVVSDRPGSIAALASKGQVWAMFATKAKAEQYRDKVNAGNVRSDINARSAVVRPAYNLGSAPWDATPADDAPASA